MSRRSSPASRGSRILDRIRENISGRPQQARFDSMNRGEQVRYSLKLWLLWVVVVGTTLAFGRGRDDPLAWVGGLIVISALVFAAITWYSIAQSEKRKARQSEA